MLTLSGMTDSEKNDFINFIYGQLKEREAQNEALHAKLDAQIDRFDKLQATLDAISSQLAESNRMKEVLQKGFDNMYAQLDQMKNELVKTQKDLRKSQREAKKYREMYEVLRDEKFVTKSQKSKQSKAKGRDDDRNGSRGRKVLTDFIGDAEIAALQSDAYNVYKYLDSELTEVEHICCMAHVRHRFLKALIQGKDERARFFFDRINELYKKEDFYKKNSYLPNKIKEERHDARTTELITEIRMELTRLLTAEDPKSDLLTNALNYFDNSWKQVMAWWNDGRYTIDRSALPLRSSKKVALKGCFYAWTSKLTIYYTDSRCHHHILPHCHHRA